MEGHIMKKILSILLTLCMVIGIALCGTVSAGAGLIGDLLVKGTIVGDILEKLPLLAKIAAYWYLISEQESLWPEFEAGLLPGKTLDEIRAAMDTMEGTFEDMYLRDFFASTATTQELEQILAFFDKLFAESFTSEFLAKFYTFRDTLTQATDQFYRAYAKLGAMKLSGAIYLLPVDLRDEALELLAWLDNPDNIDIPEDAASLASLTARFADVITRINTTMAKVEGYKPQWWKNLPAIVQWILRYVLFGWLWMK